MRQKRLTGKLLTSGRSFAWSGRKFHGAVRTSRIEFRNLTQSRGVGGLSAKWEEAMWLALAAITLAVAIGFCFLALAIQDF